MELWGPAIVTETPTVRHKTPAISFVPSSLVRDLGDSRFGEFGISGVRDLGSLRFGEFVIRGVSVVRPSSPPPSTLAPSRTVLFFNFWWRGVLGEGGIR